MTRDDEPKCPKCSCACWFNGRCAVCGEQKPELTVDATRKRPCFQCGAPLLDGEICTRDRAHDSRWVGPAEPTLVWRENPLFNLLRRGRK